VFGRIGEAAGIAQLWRLLERRGCRSGRWGGFGDGIVDSGPDEGIVRIVGEGYFQERFDTAEVEVVGVDGGIES